MLRLDNIKNYKQYYFEHVERYHNLFDFKNIWNKQVGKLSGGEEKLLFFSIISSMEKKWYIFDEPFASVDKTNREIIIEIMKGLIEKERNIIITSHMDEFLISFEEVHIISLEECL